MLINSERNNTACWEPTFKIIHPSELEFFGLDGIKKPCVPLYAMANVMYAVLPKYEAELLRIPLNDAGWEMLLLVPKTNSGLVRLLLRLRKPGELSSLLNESPAIRPMHVYLPKFRLTQTAPLYAEKTLKKCGVTSLFDARTADLSEMCSDARLSVADIVHRVTFEPRSSVRWFSPVVTEVTVSRESENFPTAVSALSRITGHITAFRHGRDKNID
ncbi:leukocyte elastase inhibitor [Clonorchis sinensis]|uniref:Leukocyte elastase inhibitor n=1 Tax=Clonorchis sinensis TaxID=79923 RepID=G7Y9C5_CLOSI|nr:leukocyte elastase inhibitor [Clonorchis sinensis]